MTDLYDLIKTQFQLQKKLFPDFPNFTTRRHPGSTSNYILKIKKTNEKTKLSAGVQTYPGTNFMSFLSLTFCLVLSLLSEPRDWKDSNLFWAHRIL